MHSVECSTVELYEDDRNWRRAYNDHICELVKELRSDRDRGCEFKLVYNRPRVRVCPRNMSNAQIESVAREWARQSVERAINERRMAEARSKARAGQAF